MSDETIGSSVYWRIPSQWSDVGGVPKHGVEVVDRRRPLEAAHEAVTEPSGTGTRIAIPSSLPFSSGMTSPIARAAPVDAGTMLSAAERMRRRSGLPFRVIAT